MFRLLWGEIGQNWHDDNLHWTTYKYVFGLHINTQMRKSRQNTLRYTCLHTCTPTPTPTRTHTCTHAYTHPCVHTHTHTHTHTCTCMLFLIESFSYSLTHLVSSYMWCMNSSSLTPVYSSAVTNSVFDRGVTCASLGLRPQFHRCPPPAGPQRRLWWAAGQAEGGCGGCHCLARVSVCVVFLMIAACMLISCIAEWFMHMCIWRCEHTYVSVWKFLCPCINFHA